MQRKHARIVAFCLFLILPLFYPPMPLLASDTETEVELVAEKVWRMWEVVSEYRWKFSVDSEWSLWDGDARQYVWCKDGCEEIPQCAHIYRWASYTTTGQLGDWSLWQCGGPPGGWHAVEVDESHTLYHYQNSCYGTWYESESNYTTRTLFKYHIPAVPPAAPPGSGIINAQLSLETPVGWQSFPDTMHIEVLPCGELVEQVINVLPNSPGHWTGHLVFDISGCISSDADTPQLEILVSGLANTSAAGEHDCGDWYRAQEQYHFWATEPQLLVTYGKPEPDITVTASCLSLPSNGSATSAVTVTALWRDGSPAGGEQINLSISGTGRISPESGLTDSNGGFQAVYTSGTTAGTTTITATDTTQTPTTNASTDITLGPTALIIQPELTKLSLGDSTTYTIVAFDGNGNTVLPLAPPPTSTVSPSEAGTITGNGATPTFTAANTLPFGTDSLKATVTATIIYCQSITLSSSASALIKPPKLESLTISPAEAQVDIGQTLTFTATAYERKPDKTIAPWNTAKHPLTCTWTVLRDDIPIEETSGTNKMSFTYKFTQKSKYTVKIKVGYSAQEKSATAKITAN